MNRLINVRGKLLDLSNPVVMGILNITPDSFFDGGKYFLSSDAIRKRIDQIIEEGASIVDLGAYSSRPGADDISSSEEWNRLSRAFEIISKYYPDLIVSVDTFRSEIAHKSVENGGAAIINDISGGLLDANMFDTIAKLHVPYILMHMQGNPQNMQINPHYCDVMKEIVSFFSENVLKLRKLGVNDVILDPGFGFGKTVEHNYEVLNRLNEFNVFDLPLLVGISRKSMIYKPLNCTPANSLNGTTILNTISLSKGASILRVHDVREAVECIKLTGYCYKTNN